MALYFQKGTSTHYVCFNVVKTAKIKFALNKEIMSGISFVTNEKGKKTAVIIELSRHKRLWEDFYDTLLIEQRKNEERIPWDKAKDLLRRKARGTK